MMRFSVLVSALICSSLAGAALAPAAVAADPVGPAEPGGTSAGETVTHEVFSPSGHIRRVAIPEAAEPAAPRTAAAAVTATVTPIEVNGPSANRIDLVFLGDGYAADDQALYAQNVTDNWKLLADREPYASYRTSFNVWRVDIVSPVSGVSGDPTADIRRDTPLHTEFWCGGIERLLCADVQAARAYASLAPEADEIAVLANSTKYGGAGYPFDELVTIAGNNALAGEIAPHELGHSIGDLADEYDYADGTTYAGPEPSQANLSIYDADQMRAQGTKWAGWLGTESPDGGPVDTYEGAFYSQFGVYRPSQDSIMRSLFREFNSPSREKMVQSFYATATPIDAVAPESVEVRPRSTLTVDPLPTATETRWYADGKEVRRWRDQLSVRLTGLGGNQTHRVSVTSSDPTPWVIDQTYRDDFLSETHEWLVTRS